MKIYNNSTHRTVELNPADVNINETRRYYNSGILKVGVHGRKAIPLRPTEKSCRQLCILANNYRKVWEAKFAAL